MRVFGLIGNPISQSLSPHFFQQKFEREGITDAVYQLFPLESITDLPFLIENENNCVGLNVTHPYKEAIFPYLHQLTNEAQAIGAVNTVSIRRTDGRVELTGHNTDCAGFSVLLNQIAGALPERALVMGTGGAAKAVAYALRQRGAKVAQVSRSDGRGDYTYGSLTPEVIERHLLIVNATPVGMGADRDSCPPIPYPAITPRHTLIDLIYHPEVTVFLRKGAELGAQTHNGMTMLVGQAEASWRFWTSKGILSDGAVLP